MICPKNELKIEKKITKNNKIPYTISTIHSYQRMSQEFLCIGERRSRERVVEIEEKNILRGKIENRINSKGKKCNLGLNSV